MLKNRYLMDRNMRRGMNDGRRYGRGRDRAMDMNTIIQNEIAEVMIEICPTIEGKIIIEVMNNMDNIVDLWNMKCME